MTDIEKLKELEARLRTYALAEDIFGQERRDLESAADLLASLASKDEEIEILHDAEARWIARLSVLRMHSGDNGKMMLAEFSTWFEKRWNELLAAETSLASKDAEIERLKADLAREEGAHSITVDQRDAAENCIGDIYFEITGRAPEWSNQFGYDDAFEEISVRAEAAESRLTTALAALERIYRFGDGYSEHRPEQGKFAGTTGQGHAECREIARATLAKLNALEGNEDD